MSKKKKNKKKTPAPAPLSNLQQRRGLASGDPDILGRMFEQHRELVFRSAYLILRDVAGAKDVTQDLFTTLMTRPFNVTKPAAWLANAAQNRARTALRDQRRHDDKLRTVHQWLTSAPEDAETVMAMRIDAERLYELAHDADSPFGFVERYALQLILGGDSIAEMARTIGIPESTMRDLKRRVLETIRALLQVHRESGKTL